MMAHTAPVNIGVFFGITGRIITTSSACTSGSQGIGYAYEAIQPASKWRCWPAVPKSWTPRQAAVFDTLFATSTQAQRQPDLTPTPL